MPILLTEADVKALLTMDDLIPAMADALAAFSARKVTQPLRTVLTVGEQQAFYGVMPAYIPGTPALGTKLVTVFSGNTARGLTTHLATIVLLDPETGALLSLMDGRYITEARTAAVSAVSVQHLAREDADVLAILGTGVQARSHLEAIARVRPLKDVRVWSRTPANVDLFVREMQSHVDCAIRRMDSARDAVRDAAIVALTTAAKEPVLYSDWIADGTHICAVGACRPSEREMEGALVARADLFVDSREAALAEAGDIVLPIKEGLIGAESHQGRVGRNNRRGSVRRKTRGGSGDYLQVTRDGGRGCCRRAPCLSASHGARRRSGSQVVVTYLCGVPPSASSSSRRCACGPPVTSCGGAAFP